MLRLLTCLIVFAFSLCRPVAALAAGHPTVPGAELTVYWVIPFACMLLSIAVMPLLAPHFWEHHFGKISIFWALAFTIPCAIVFGLPVAFYELLHIILLDDYVPFIILFFALFTVAAGVRHLHYRASPRAASSA